MRPHSRRRKEFSPSLAPNARSVCVAARGCACLPVLRARRCISLTHVRHQVCIWPTPILSPRSLPRCTRFSHRPRLRSGGRRCSRRCSRSGRARALARATWPCSPSRRTRRCCGSPSRSTRPHSSARPTPLAARPSGSSFGLCCSACCLGRGMRRCRRVRAARRSRCSRGWWSPRGRPRRGPHLLLFARAGSAPFRDAFLARDASSAPMPAPRLFPDPDSSRQDPTLLPSLLELLAAPGATRPRAAAVLAALADELAPGRPCRTAPRPLQDLS